MKDVVNKLIELNKTIATMESCTGGGVANAITNIEGASAIIKFSAVTYSNEYKIKMGVDKEVIDKYTVYSMETAKEMSKNISLFANSNYGVGITGQINKVDPANVVDNCNTDDDLCTRINDNIGNIRFTQILYFLPKIVLQSSKVIDVRKEAFAVRILSFGIAKTPNESQR